MQDDETKVVFEARLNQVSRENYRLKLAYDTLLGYVDEQVTSRNCSKALQSILKARKQLKGDLSEGILEKRIEERIMPEPNSGCWLWIGALRDNGYPQLGFSRKKGVKYQVVSAHRYIYKILVGPIPEGLELDHLCRTPCCVNPQHLEPVTQEENLRRARQAAKLNARTKASRAWKKCPKGHVYSENSPPTKGKGQRCKICLRARNQAKWVKYKADVASGKSKPRVRKKNMLDTGTETCYQEITPAA